MNVSGQGVSCPVATSGTAYPPGLLNPGATAFYPMVPGASCSHSIGGTCEPSPEPAPGLPRCGSFSQADLAPFTSSCLPVATHGEGCVTTGVNVPRDSAFPGGGPGLLGDVPQRLVCGCKCDACEAPCVLQRTGHSMHGVLYIRYREISCEWICYLGRANLALTGALWYLLMFYFTFTSPFGSRLDLP